MISTNRKRLTQLLSLAALTLLPTLLVLQNANAQQGPYPNRTVRIIAPFATGGAVDALARTFAQVYSESLGKTFIVENRPGASGNIGLGVLARSPADGYTLALGSANMMAMNPWLYSSLPFDTLKDFTPVAFIGRMPAVLIINPSVPANNMKELISVMKANKMHFNYSSSGAGNSAHLFGELFKRRTGVEMEHIAYKSSGQALIAVISGQVQLQFVTPVELMPQLARGAVRAIAVAAPERLAALPNVPTFAELGMPGFESSTWFGIFARTGTPKEIIALLYRETKKAIMTNPMVKTRLAQVGAEPSDMTPEQFQAFIIDELGKWGEIVKQSGVHTE